jgi:prepilin-type N-terminal cleavage/methylation domain-containing protein
MNCLRRDERGVTLLELLVALPIAAMIVIAASGAIFQMLNSTSARNHMIAYREVQTAGYWISYDGVQAQTVTTGPNAGFPLIFGWIDWDSGNEYCITYTLEDMSGADLWYVERQESVNGVPEGTTLVVQYIHVDTEPAKPTNCVWDGQEKVLTFTVRAEVAQESAIRTYEIKPRPLS